MENVAAPVAADGGHAADTGATNAADPDNTENLHAYFQGTFQDQLVK